MSSIFSFVSVLSCIIVMSLSFTIFLRQMEVGFILYHSIISLIGAIASIVSTIILYRYKNTYNNHQINSTYLATVTIISFILSMYFLASVSFVYLNTQHHTSYLIQKEYKNGFQNSVFLKDKNLKFLIEEDRRIHFFMAFFTLVSFVSLLASGIISLQVNRRSLLTAQMIIGLSGYLTVVLGLFSLYYIFISQQYLQSYVLRNIFNIQHFQFTLYLMVLIVILTIVALFFNILKIQIVNFSISMILMIVLFTLLIITSLNVKNLNIQQKSHLKNQCEVTLRTVSEEFLKKKGYCEEKYIE